MKVLLLIAGILLFDSTPNYVVVNLDSRETAVVCVNDTRPIITQSTKLPNVVLVKCIKD